MDTASMELVSVLKGGAMRIVKLQCASHPQLALEMVFVVQRKKDR